MDRLMVFLLMVVAALAPQLAARADAPTRPRSVFEGMPELRKPVTYNETKIPLGDLVAKVAQDTGARLSASKEVADEPVVVAVKELSARELLEQVAELLDYRWRRSGVQAFRRSGVQGETAPSGLNARMPERRNAPSFE